MNRAFALLFLLCTLAAAPGARAQLGGALGGLPLPTTEVPRAGEIIEGTGEVAEELGRPLRQLRRFQVQELLGAHRRELEADPNGQPMVRSQILALGMSEAAVAAARARGFAIVRTDEIDGAAMATLRAPPDMSTRQALRALRQADPEGVYDFDHLHLESGAALVSLAAAQSGAVGSGPSIGLIDSGVGGSVSVAAQRGFASEAPVEAAHGTMIAGLLSSAAPGARIYAADIYGGAPTGGASSALARALAWMQDENVPVINVSLVGPRNRVIEAVVSRLIGRGFVIVAAVGNDGPAAAPLFPAAYDGVVGVTGVDAGDRVLIEAGRGAQVDFAALGLYGSARGTSYAAPIVAAHLAASISAPDSSSAGNALAAMRGRARDLGRRGRDDVYGYGLVSAP